ncbi:unnamed protein product [Aphanomyces euteiches]|uniref:Peptidase C51 domain-containing protein n=1 Tax=Aphanomyces euteiches TaxID=100861 RepID=A0A6G0XQ91_9STRA|nr:hypothetical protein Ae201684_002492 [Aphanomyces euteiches]KAH9092802.1 hypothetical protein Ae201684P_008471 [Aphanomyces euteiches]
MLAPEVAGKEMPPARKRSRQVKPISQQASTRRMPLFFGKPGLPHGTVLGSAHGVEGYNNNYRHIPADGDDNDGSHYLDGLYMGYKWQCVEYARRYWVKKRDIYLPSIPHAAHIWTRVTHVKKLDDSSIVPLRKLPNHGTEKPDVGDLLVYKSTPGQYVGHVAVVVDVLEKQPGHWVVHVAEQNQYNNRMWKGDNYADELKLETKTREDGKTTYGITHRDRDLVLDGWVRPHFSSPLEQP